jgi:hypothetical protein
MKKGEGPENQTATLKTILLDIRDRKFAVASFVFKLLL